ncbi:MAG: hypothetical protein JWL90_2022 [Chthoniobacteraceae bacterium]|nr:hypothetical protein [Chthoniobacteraceae bacterium]
MNKFIRPLSSATALVLTLSSAFAETAVTLKQQWQPGKRYLQTMKMDQSTKMKIGDIPMDQKMSMSANMSMAVTKLPDGKRKRLALKYEHLLVDTDMGGQKMKIDSDKPDATAPGGNAFAAIVGKEIRAIIDADDKVTEFENLDEIVGATAGNPMASGILNKETLNTMINQSALQALPGKPVKAGDSWPFNIDVPMPQMGKVSIKGTYTYKGTVPHNGVPCAEIAVAGSITSTPDAAGAKNANPLAALGMKMESGSMKGTVWFDNTLGTARSSEMNQEMNMSMNNPLNPGDVIKIPVKQVVTVEQTNVEEIK